jgi:hypothetical protein
MNFQLFKFLFLFAGLCLLLTDVTDADLIDKKNISKNQFQATTLDFTKTNTVNNQHQDVLFNIDKIIPGGFSVNTFRLKNSGQILFKYQINFEIGNSSNYDFCKNLDIKLIQNNQVKYQGSLVNLNLEIPGINNIGQDDWVFFVSFNSSTNSLQNQNCDFNLNIYGWQPNQGKNAGFNYQQSLFNHISSGNW